MDYKVIFTSDWHLGLHTDGFDRNKDILNIVKQLYSHCRKLNNLKCIVLGGDIFDKNNPNEKDIAFFLKVLNKLSTLCKIYIITGNHEAIHDGSRASCLSFLYPYSEKNPNIKIIEDVKVIKAFDTDGGPLHFIFLPHLTKYNLQDTKFDDVQDYINAKTKSIFKKIGKGQSIAFSHLDIKNYDNRGSEERMLKKSNLRLPEEMLTGVRLVDIAPTVINGHLHSRGKLDNVHVIGSPIYTDFKDCDRSKYFAEITISDSITGDITVDYIETKCSKFVELDIDIMDEVFSNLIEVDGIKNFVRDIQPNSFVKFSIKMSPEQASVIDFNRFRMTLEESKQCQVKPILPQIINVRTVRSDDQKVDLPLEDALKIFIKNMPVKSKKSKFILGKKFINNLEVN